MAGKQQHQGEFNRLLSLYTETIPVSRHHGVSHRREGIIESKNEDKAEVCWTENDTLQTLDGCCSYDEYLGLRWYHEDPLPLIQQACESNNLLFRDDEFPVHPYVHTDITLNNNNNANNNNEEVFHCIPGVITPSNCTDFQNSGVPKRVKRIEHFTDRAKLSGGSWKWMRGSSIMEGECTLFSSDQSIDPRNVIQGKVGNCGFCSGFASIAAACPSLIRNAFGKGSTASLSTSCGAVSILLYPQGKPRYLLLDDYILCQDDDTTTIMSEEDGSSRKTKSPSMHSLLNQDLWVRLLEKAFVKIQGAYASLDGYYKFNSLYRHPGRAMQLLTGAPLAMELHYSTMDEDMMYDILAGATQWSFARVAHCRKRIDNLIPNHGYSLLWVGEGLACLRNPHGRGSYTGMFGLGHTEELRRILFGEDDDNDGNAVPTCFTVCKTTGRVVWKNQQQQDGDAVETNPAYCLTSTDHDDGIFFLPFGTYVECFPITTICGPIRQDSRVEIDVPECVHKVERENLSHVCDIIDSARSLLK